MKPDPAHIELNPTFYTMLAQVDALVPENVKKFFFIVKMQFEHLLGMLTLPLEVFLRHSFGVRAISLLQLLQMVSLGMLLGVFGDPLLKLFGLAVMALTCHHYREARKWVKNGKPWRYSYFIGEPRSWWLHLQDKLAAYKVNVEWYLHPEMIYRFYEPALVALVALPVFLLSPFLACFLLASSLALLIRMHIRHQRMLAERWDRNDALVVGQHLSEMEDPTGKRRQIAPCIARLASIPLVIGPRGDHKTGSPRPHAESIGLAQESRDDTPLELPEESQTGSPVRRIPANDSVDGFPPPSQPNRMKCKTCGNGIQVAAKHAGRKVRCPHCGNPIAVPKLVAEE